MAEDLLTEGFGDVGNGEARLLDTCKGGEEAPPEFVNVLIGLCMAVLRSHCWPVNSQDRIRMAAFWLDSPP